MPSYHAVKKTLKEISPPSVSWQQMEMSGRLQWKKSGYPGFAVNWNTPLLKRK
jgi:hypothetical protein